MVSGEADGSKRTVVASGTINTLESVTNILNLAAATIAGIVDMAHTNYPFPPSFDILAHSELGIADSGSEDKTWDEADWGVGTHLYIIGIIIDVRGTTEFNTKVDEGFWPHLFRTSDSASLFDHSFKDSPFQDAAKWRVAKTIFLPIPARVASTDSLTYRMQNFTGQMIDWGAGILFFTGST